jgi:hypothetical protein
VRAIAGLCLISVVACGGSAPSTDGGARRDTPPLGDTRAGDGQQVDARPSDGSRVGDAGDARATDVDAPGDDPDAQLGGTVLDCGFHNVTDSAKEVMRFPSGDGRTEVLIVREAVGMGIGLSTEYALRAFAVVREGRLHCVDQAARLAYQSSHHNWVDWAEATIDGVRHHLDMQYQPTGDASPPVGPWVWTYRLTGLDAGGTRLWGPEDLSCQDLHGQGCGKSGG